MTIFIIGWLVLGLIGMIAIRLMVGAPAPVSILLSMWLCGAATFLVLLVLVGIHLANWEI